ncbi:uncharacterized protein LOC113850649 [Abrus precatorius]|uniref:Uncharacterized protein LOC113850649 n=1 Tax=Abrus precatorius TaxID=3816 RepID=A0A8B8K1Y7_ABRPR|nr:uncharacterized protein LOC113850649 [Abrus precatorius]
MLRVQEEKVIFNVFEAIKHPSDDMSCMKIDVIDAMIPPSLEKNYESAVLESTLAAAKCSIYEEQDEEVKDCILQLDSFPCMNNEINQLKEELHQEEEKKDESKVELKQLPSHLRYVFLEEGHNKPIIINSNLQKDQEEKLLRVLRKHKSALGWQISDLKGIDPFFCMHIILFEGNCKPVVQPQRRLNPTMKEVVRQEVMKLLDVKVIYPISDSSWVSLVHVVPKKGGITVVPNEKNELIPTRTVTGWRMCIDYRKLNDASRKDHFPLPFADQMLERLARFDYYCFLDGYSGYNQIAVDPRDQENTTFTCPFGVFAY